MTICLYVSCIFVRGDRLEERAIDLFDHVPFGCENKKVCLQIRITRSHTRISELVLRTNTDPLRGRLDLDCPSCLKDYMHYLKESEIDSIRLPTFYGMLCPTVHLENTVSDSSKSLNRMER